MGECRYCGGEIPVAAVKCQHCGEWLDDKARRQTTKEAGPLFRIVFIALLLFVLWLVLTNWW